jgi:CRP/FNR family transcriptional regulator
VGASHQTIADELGSVREIISRLLRQFEDQGLVTLGRERIEVLDAPGLKRAAEPG